MSWDSVKNNTQHDDIQLTQHNKGFFVTLNITETQHN